MAQVAEGRITAGGSRGVGRVHVDPGLLSGEGGPLEPRLVMPIWLEMLNRPEEQMLALLHLTGRLYLENTSNPDIEDAEGIGNDPAFATCDTRGTVAVRCTACGETFGLTFDHQECDSCDAVYEVTRDRKGEMEGVRRVS